MERHCISCLSILIEGTNWYTCYKNKKHYLCQKCACKGYKAKNGQGYQKSGRIKKSVAELTWGITDDIYEIILNAQDRVCLICGGQQTQGRKFAVDHDHATGKVRGLLCTRCNTALGSFKDSTSSLNRAILYLEGAI